MPTDAPTAEIRDSTCIRASENRPPKTPTTIVTTYSSLKAFKFVERDGHWEVNIRIAGDFINPAFTEIDRNDLVKGVVGRNLPFNADRCGMEEISSPCAELIMERESWIINGSFKVDVDTADFGHTVGEVSMTRTFRYAAGKEEETKFRKRWTKRAFIQSCLRPFPARRPPGKECLFQLAEQSDVTVVDG